MTVTRTSVNPWPWSLGYGFDQAQLVEGATRVLVLSGQAAVDADGTPATSPLRSRSLSTTSRPCSGRPG
jgi:hypothetical protein